MIEIKAIARRAGYKSKVIVAQADPNIDPVGTCIGVGGRRIKPILKELNGEKIDIFSWSNSKEELVALRFVRRKLTEWKFWVIAGRVFGSVMTKELLL